MNGIIDNVHDLMKMSREELDEILLDKKYNSAMLRELVRRTLNVAKEYKFSLEINNKNLIEVDEKIIEFKNDIAKALAKFNNN